MKEITTEKAKETMIEILDYLDKVCSENNLKYFLAYGTLIGAVRHKGFIPWDDDIDVIMERKDLDRFVDIVNSSNNASYSIFSSKNRDDYPLVYAKLAKNNTKEVMLSDSFKDINIGINIDIFPLDHVSKEILKKDNLDALRQHQKHYQRKSLCAIKGDSLIKNCIKTIVHYCYSFVDYKNDLNKVENVILQNTGNDLAMLYNEHSLSYYEPEVFSESIKGSFENKEYPIPKEYDRFLTSFYGNYMVPPKEEKRKSTHVNKYYIF